MASGLESIRRQSVAMGKTWNCSKHQIMALGDAANDLEMLQFVGQKCWSVNVCH